MTKYRVLYTDEPQPAPVTHEYVIESDVKYNPDDAENRTTDDGGMVVEVLSDNAVVTKVDTPDDYELESATLEPVGRKRR